MTLLGKLYNAIRIGLNLRYAENMDNWYSQMVSAELQNLNNHGWSDKPMQANGLHVAQIVDQREISFPSEAYDKENGNQEADGIWATLRAIAINSILKKNKIEVLWEVGSGDGNVAIPLAQKKNAVICIEPLVDGALVTARQGFRTYLGTLESLQLPSNSISAIGAFDVLEHLENPNSLLSEIHRVLKPGGLLLLTVPAHQWLYSDFDESIGHFRRYSKRLLISSLEQTGFRNSRATHMFSILVLPAYFLRKIPSWLGRNRDSKRTMKASKKQKRIMQLIKPVVMLSFFLDKYFNLPFGLSLLSVSRK